MPRFSHAFAAIVLLCTTSLAFGQGSDKAQAKGRELATSALELFNKGSYAEALKKFQEAESAYPTGQVLRMEGYTLAALKRYMEAADLLERALTASFKPLPPADSDDAKSQLAEVKKNLATVTIRAAIDNASVRLDGGAPLPLPQTVRMLPGSHHFIIEAANHETLDVMRLVSVGDSDLELTPRVKPAPAPKPASAPAPKPSNLFAGWFPHQKAIGLAVAGVGLAVSSTALGLGIYGTSLNSAVQTNVNVHYSNYDASCAQNTALCFVDLALINQDGARAAAYRNAALVTGLTGAGLALFGALSVSFAPDGPFAPRTKTPAGTEGPSGNEPSSVARLRLRCGVTGVGAACDGSF